MSSRFIFAVLLAIATITSANPTNETGTSTLSPLPAQSSTTEPASPLNDVPVAVETAGQSNSSSLLFRSEALPAPDHTELSSNDSVGADLSNPATVLASRKKNTEVREVVSQCYTCNSFEDADKCLKPNALQLKQCHPNQHACHYIVGTVVQNGVTEKNVVMAGCDVAPAANLPNIADPIIHTAHSDLTCRDFAFLHSDTGAAGQVKTANVEISFKGKSCNCQSIIDPGCNKAYADLLENSSEKSRISFGILLASLAVLVAGKIF